jgi:hypothetical protein
MQLKFVSRLDGRSASRISLRASFDAIDSTHQALLSVRRDGWQGD